MPMRNAMPMRPPLHGDGFHHNLPMHGREFARPFHANVDQFEDLMEQPWQGRGYVR